MRVDRTEKRSLCADLGVRRRDGDQRERNTDQRCETNSFDEKQVPARTSVAADQTHSGGGGFSGHVTSSAYIVTVVFIGVSNKSLEKTALAFITYLHRL